jgi:hypothetical protein
LQEIPKAAPVAGFNLPATLNKMGRHNLKLVTGVNMEHNTNPIIQDRTTDTLAHVRDILALLQEFFSSSNLPSTDYERSIHLGIYWILIISEHALAFEMERVE